MAKFSTTLTRDMNTFLALPYFLKRKGGLHEGHFFGFLLQYALGELPIIHPEFSVVRAFGFLKDHEDSVWFCL